MTSISGARAEFTSPTGKGFPTRQQPRTWFARHGTRMPSVEARPPPCRPLLQQRTSKVPEQRKSRAGSIAEVSERRAQSHFGEIESEACATKSPCGMRHAPETTAEAR